MVVRNPVTASLENERTDVPGLGKLCAANVYLNAHHGLVRPVGYDVRDWVVKAPHLDPMDPSNWIVFDNSADRIEDLMHYWPSCLDIPGASLFTYIFLQ
jgi:hypothetical protein